jgi:predicted nuclease of predicted toxin-antitoxin system
LKLLFDQNLSRKLVNRLADIFPESSHVQFHGLAEKTDTEIWEFAKLNDFCIVTQDADFAERSRLYGSPPKVVWWEIIRGLMLPYEVFTAEEMVGQVEYL